jgi:catechol 2,3-dioxygenase-like lactoylglutathione lyase family enzyme
MSEAAYFHVGILVPDINEAMARFSEVLGLEFAEPTISHVPQLDEGEETSPPFDALITYSRQGPPHIELLESRGQGAYGQHHGFGLHHIGAWSHDVKAQIEAMKMRGAKTEAVFRDGDRVLGCYFKPSVLYGVRYELSPTSIRDGWQAWVNGKAGAFM